MMIKGKSGFRPGVFSVFLVLVGAGVSFADVRPAALISDNMILQRGVPASIWGWAEPGERVSVTCSWTGSKWVVFAGDDGRWMVKIKPPEAGGPYEMSICGQNAIKIKNIMSGEVWVGSGQSNMEMPVGPVSKWMAGVCNYEQEIASANYPQIRLFTVEHSSAGQPQYDCKGRWLVCSSQTVAGFSATAYFFGREIHTGLGIPVGLIHSSWGGSPVEAWASKEVVDRFDYFQRLKEKIKYIEANRDKLQKQYEQQMRQWHKKTAASDAGVGAGSFVWARSEFDDSGWAEMRLPQYWEAAGLADFDGVVWFRKQMNVRRSWARKAAVLELGPIDDMDVTWVNGIRVGGYEVEGYWDKPRSYEIAPGVLKPGRNVIVVRVLDSGGGGGMHGNAEQMKLRSADAADGRHISLAGEWRYKVGCSLKSLAAMPKPPFSVREHHIPSALYNGMIQPLIPYGIAGVIWYQGEANASRAYQYRQLFRALINDWREAWGQGDFPFYFVQLANFKKAAAEPAESEWAELREAQLMALETANTGMAVAIDIGEAEDIHPKNKQDVGRRLALWALAKTYGKEVVYSGPVYKSMTVEGSKVVLRFEHTAGGLVAAGNEKLKGFAIAAADRKFVWADASIEGDTVVVSCEKVAKPVAVRYGWSNNPVCNLYNRAGLPASPFRTDDWPGLTFENR